MEWASLQLQDVAPAVPARNLFGPDDVVWHLGLDQIESHAGSVTHKHRAPGSSAGNSTLCFDEGNVLYSKLRPYLNKVVVPDEPGVATTELIPLRPDPRLICREYLGYYLRSASFLAYASQYVTGAKMPRVILDKFWAHEIPLPPLSEQRRIVEILDQADRLRRLSVEANAKADRILPALFLKMFGDPTTNPMGWPLVSFDEVFRDITSRCPKIQRKRYSASGAYPVVDQGKELIVAYTDDASLCFRPERAVIVFGDHTRVVKFIDFTFVAGADGSRVFEASDEFVPEFAAQLLHLQEIQNLGYSRHMRVVRRMVFMSPPLEMQAILGKAYSMYRGLLTSMGSAVGEIERIWDSLVHRAFSGALTPSWREAHMEELLQEMEQQAKALRGASV